MTIPDRFDYRPTTYWDLPAGLLANIKGERRRQLITRVAATGDLADLDPRWLAETLTEEEQNALALLHPSLMGGEFLPDYRSGEVEIARICLESFLADVISLRARKEGAQIRYRMVDEYDNDYEFAPTATDMPLRLAELIHLIDTASNPFTDSVGLTSSFRDDNLEPGIDPKTLVTFVRVSSLFYPQLEAHYRADATAWLAAVRSRLGPHEGPPK